MTPDDDPADTAAVPEEIQAVQKASAAELHSIAVAGQGPALSSVFAANLDRPVTRDTFDEVERACLMYMAQPTLTTLMWLATASEDHLYRPEEERIALSEEAVAMVRPLLAIYGGRLLAAFHSSDRGGVQRSEDWAGLERRIMKTVGDEGRYEISHIIRKVDGERFTMRSSPNSVLRLGTYLLESVVLVRDGAAISLEDFEDLRQQFDGLQTLVESLDERLTGD